MADIEITSPNIPAVTAWRTDAPIVPSGGYGGHPIAARPKRAALTVWEGRQPFQMAVPILLDNGGPNYSVEALRASLDRMASSINDTPPPQVNVTSNLGHLPIPTDVDLKADWWIEDLAWGEEKRRGTDGELYYQEVVVTLLERTDDPSLKEKTPTVKTDRAHNYKVKKGDTWHSIAASQLGNASRWEQLWKLNGKKSDAKLAKMVGQTVHIPATKSG